MQNESDTGIGNGTDSGKGTRERPELYASKASSRAEQIQVFIAGIAIGNLVALAGAYYMMPRPTIVQPSSRLPEAPVLGVVHKDGYKTLLLCNDRLGNDNKIDLQYATPLTLCPHQLVQMIQQKPDAPAPVSSSASSQ